MKPKPKNKQPIIGRSWPSRTREQQMTALRQQFINNGVTTLSSGCDDTETTITVASGGVFPATGRFSLRIDDEILTCVARSTNDLTVVRAQEGTSGVSHSTGATVSAVTTVGGIQRWAADNAPLWGSTRPPYGLYDAAGDLIDSSDFTFVNTGSSTATDQAGSILLTKGSQSSLNISMLVRAALTPPYTVTAAFQFIGLARDSHPSFGLCFYNTGSTKGHFLRILNHATGGQLCQFLAFNSPSSGWSDIVAPDQFLCIAEALWLRLEDDGTDLRAYVGDGLNWLPYGVEGRTVHSTPDRVGFCVDNDSSAGQEVMVRLIHWSEDV